MNAYVADTIVALATPVGRGGVGIVRVSGAHVPTIMQAMLGKTIAPRSAELLPFLSADGAWLDQGIALYFKAPHSFTGEDVLELQGHGGPLVMDSLIQRVVSLGARMAEPGEFSQRAFLNDKIDLVQAEAIADLIAAGSQQAASAALRSLQGDFSEQINKLLKQLIELRMFVEAAIDFAEEEIDFISDGKVGERLAHIVAHIDGMYASAKQGQILQEGMTIVIAGAPNAGKSSLLNRLSGTQTAIVTDIPGTTRDVLQTHIHINGLPLHIIDTAGLRNSDCQVEQEGVRRALAAITQADHVLLVKDVSQPQLQVELDYPELQACQRTVVFNKIDLTQETTRVEQQGLATHIYLSAKHDQGIDQLSAHLQQCAGYQGEAGVFSARRRHLTALAQTLEHLQQAQQVLQQHQAGELVAEELRLAQQSLGQITGQFSADDLLSEIFSHFCIGK